MVGKKILGAVKVSAIQVLSHDHLFIKINRYEYRIGNTYLATLKQLQSLDAISWPTSPLFTFGCLFYFFLLFSQVDRRDVKFVLWCSGCRKGVCETLNILVRESARSRRATIYDPSPRMRHTGRKNVFSLYSPVPSVFSFARIAPRERATRIDPSFARDELPANAPPKQIFASEKETFQPSRVDVLKRFYRTSPPAARYSRCSIASRELATTLTLNQITMLD